MYATHNSVTGAFSGAPAFRECHVCPPSSYKTALNNKGLPAEEPSPVTMQLFTAVQLSVALALVRIVHGQAAEWGVFLP